MKLNARGGVSIVELFVYFPSLVAAIIICSRHGFTRSSGWIYTLILCLVRIIGACCQLTTYHDQSSGLIKATIIIDSIGVSPLLLATLGLLSRLADSINLSSKGFLGVKHFRITQVMISLGLILSIAGGSSSSISTGGQIHVASTSKVGIVLYIIAFAALCMICGLSMSNISYAETGEKRLALVVILALPLILVRLTYSALAVFVHNHDFNVIDGSVAFLIVMAVLEEFVVVFIYLIAGFRMDSQSRSQQGPIASRPWKQRGQKQSQGTSKHIPQAAPAGAYV